MTVVFNLDRQIAAEPDAVRQVLATAEFPPLDPTRPIIFTGIGTSLHAARIAAEWISRLSAGEVRPHALDAHDVGTTAALTARDQVVVISHRGWKTFPNAALKRARAAGAATIAIVGLEAPEQAADHTVRTCANETAGTFSVSYLASLAALGRLAQQFDTGGRAGFAAGLEGLPAAIAATIGLGDLPAAAARLMASSTILIVGFNRDLPTAQEAALKIKEGAWQWTEGMSPEFALHGTPAGYQQGRAAVLIEPDEDDGGRTATLRRVLAQLELGPVLSCGERPDADLPFVASHPLLRPVTGIIPFQRLTAELARLRNTNPDTMHGGREPWQAVMTGLQL